MFQYINAHSTDILILMCSISFALFAFDKISAVFKGARVPEAVLMVSGILFGAFGSLTGMVVFNHKTRKPKFYFTIPALTALQIALLWFM